MAPAAKKANTTLGVVARNGAEKIILLSYKILVDLHVGEMLPLWSLHLKKDVVELEKVHRKATEIIMGHNQGAEALQNRLQRSRTIQRGEDEGVRKLTVSWR